METLLKDINDSDRIWIYQANRRLNAEEINAVMSSGKDFVANWAAHGQQLRADINVINHLFVVVNLDEKQAIATGCSIDKSVGWISALGAKLGIDFLDRRQVAWMDEEEKLQISNIDEFEALAGQGQLTGETMVYNNLVFSGKEIKNGWLVPASESWHNRFFKVETSA